MFTGIVEEIGHIVSVQRHAFSQIITISASDILGGTNIGDSIAVNGVCLTVTSIGSKQFSADVMHETINKSSLGNLRAGMAVNLERAMPANGRFGGHIVSGHIDGVGRITKISKDDNAVWYTINAGKEIMQLINDIHEKTNKTIIIVEHRIEDVLEQPFDKVVVIDKGIVQGIGTPDEILKSDLLINSGLREPLYVEAMKLAGCNISEEKNLRDINNINEENKEILKNWFQTKAVNKPINKEEKILEIKNLTFSHDGIKNTLNDVSFHLNKGEILAVLGNNGAGKSTLCRAITGILKYNKGNIYLNNECIDSWSVKKKGSAIGYVMQNPNQMISQHMIKDEIALGLKCRGYSKEYIDEKVEEVLKICGLYPYRNWPITALSYGQKKRVTIASILAINPEVIILDEPTAGQDYRHYTEFMKFIKELSNKGISIIMVTHDMQLTLEYCDRAVVLSAGEKIADNKPSCILTDNEIIKKANLKETSLSTLAKTIDIANTNDFVQFFIDLER